MRSIIVLLMATCVCSGQGSYEGRSTDAPWRKEALARIETIRKTPLKVEVVDSQGKPTRGAKVHVRMRRHAFGFGNILNPRTTDASGSCEVSAFLGDYDIVVEHAGREMTVKATLDKPGHTETVRF